MNLSNFEINRTSFRRQGVRFIMGMAILMTLGLAESAFPAAVQQKTFASPEEAVKAVIAAARSDNDKELLAIFGAQAKDILFSGDPVADKQRRGRAIAAYDEKNRIDTKGDERILIIGKQDWPFPIPVVKKGNVWVFDVEKGREEVLNRRIGENELFTMQTMLAIVDAQRDYAALDPMKVRLPVYARRLLSSPGRMDGLYWESKPGEPESPLGPLVAKAQPGEIQRDGYYGYRYRLLYSQGADAPGGAYDYLVKDRMLGGFAVIAWPVHWGETGVMTFIVSHNSDVYEKDLGPDTSQAAAAINVFNPDKSWEKADMAP